MMTNQRTPRAAAGALLGLALLAGAGCGLDAYQKRMDEERERLKVYEEEARYLGPPLTMPTNPDDKEPPLKTLIVFLRAPRNIGTAPAEADGKFESGRTALYRYPGTSEGYNLFLAGDTGELKLAEFREQVLKALGEFSERVRKRPLALPKEEEARWTTVVAQPPETRTDHFPPVRYGALTLPKEAEEGPDASHYAVYHHQSGGNNVAIIYQVPPASAKDLAVTRGIDLSLQSLALGSPAVRRLEAYQATLPYVKHLKK